ncbi:MAG: hypothetical protein HXX13_12660 [Bacteroidetes bacterium]|nr:hypothetical protein [Bacteroidota bacterium]
MKSIFRVFLLLAVIVTAGIVVSCQPDSTSNIDPNDPRNEYVGVWQFKELGKLKNGNSVEMSYIVSITTDPDNTSQVILNNFVGAGKDVFGLVTSNQIVVSSQTLDNGVTLEGSGQKTGTGKMSWSYSTIIGGDKIYYTATATKQ